MVTGLSILTKIKNFSVNHPFVLDLLKDPENQAASRDALGPSSCPQGKDLLDAGTLDLFGQGVEPKEPLEKIGPEVLDRSKQEHVHCHTLGQNGPMEENKQESFSGQSLDGDLCPKKSGLKENIPQDGLGVQDLQDKHVLTGLEDYRVLARKYRPRHLQDLIGQDILVGALNNGFKHRRLGQGFLLTGTRGIGKTTAARVMARLFNCRNPQFMSGQEFVQVCDRCDSCLATKNERFDHLDIIEMDGASYTSVEDIRELVQGALYSPIMGAYKVYIIDEVHMLSKGAFNALLKTLEEPPAHVKFILATTEFQKIPSTIASRCLRFDLLPVSSHVLTRHLAHICKEEKVCYEDRALDLLAFKAQGSVRDALSLLDQAILIALDCKVQDKSSLDGQGSSDDKNMGGAFQTFVTEQLVQKMLGIPDVAPCRDLLKAIVVGNTLGALDQVRKIRSSGKSAYVVDALMEMVYESLLDLIEGVRQTQARSLIYVHEPEFLKFFLDALPSGSSGQGRQLSEGYLLRLWKALSQWKESPVQGPLEILIIKLSLLARLASPEHVAGALLGYSQEEKPKRDQESSQKSPWSGTHDSSFDSGSKGKSFSRDVAVSIDPAVSGVCVQAQHDPNSSGRQDVDQSIKAAEGLGGVEVCSSNCGNPLKQPPKASELLEAVPDLIEQMPNSQEFFDSNASIYSKECLEKKTRSTKGDVSVPHTKDTVVTLDVLIHHLSSLREGLLVGLVQEYAVGFYPLDNVSKGDYVLKTKRNAPGDLGKRIGQALKTVKEEWTIAQEIQEDGSLTPQEQRQKNTQQMKKAIEALPLVEKARHLFPGFALEEIHEVCLNES
jgi:DNA polymerase III subunit gamma/tau